MMPSTITDMQIAQCIQALLGKRKPTSSICPSDAARALCADEKDWRALMPRVRAVAYVMAAKGELLVTQKGEAVRPDEPVQGAIRLRLPNQTDETKP